MNFNSTEFLLIVFDINNSAVISAKGHFDLLIMQSGGGDRLPTNMHIF